MSSTARAVNVAVIALLVVAGFLVYLSQGRTFGELRRANASLTEELAQARKGTLEGESARVALTDELAQSQTEAQQAQATNVALTEKIASVLPRAQLIYDVSDMGLATSQGKDTTQDMFAWFGKITALNDPALNRIIAATAKDPKNLTATASDQYTQYLSGSIVDALR